MLVSVDQDDQNQIAKQVYRMAKQRQRHRLNNFQRGTLMPDQWQTLQKHDDSLRLPNIKQKMQKSEERCSPKTKRESQKKQPEGGKLMQLIKKEISLEKRTYFQTISSDKALIIKNSARSGEYPRQKIEKEIKEKKKKYTITQGQIQQVMTPPYKIFKSSPREAVDTHLPKTHKKIIKPYQWEEQYTPWNHKQSQDITF